MTNLIKDIAKNEIGAPILSAIILIGIAYIDQNFWTAIISIILAFLISDMILNLFVGGGKGAPQIPLLGNLIQERGYTFIAYFIGILISAILSETMIIPFFKPMIDNRILFSIVVTIAIYVDCKIRFFNR